MAKRNGNGGLLPACRELLESHPDSLRIREQVEAFEEALPDKPGVVVSFCRTIIETTCKTILTDRGVGIDAAWEAPKLISESLKYINLAPRDDGTVDARLRTGAESLVCGINQIIEGIVSIRNDHGSAAHGADAYSPLLDARYAEILARATDSVVGLLFKTHLSSARRDPLARFRFAVTVRRNRLEEMALSDDSVSSHAVIDPVIAVTPVTLDGSFLPAAIADNATSKILPQTCRHCRQPFCNP